MARYKVKDNLGNLVKLCVRQNPPGQTLVLLSNLHQQALLERTLRYKMGVSVKKGVQKAVFPGGHEIHWFQLGWENHAGWIVEDAIEANRFTNVLYSLMLGFQGIGLLDKILSKLTYAEVTQFFALPIGDRDYETNVWKEWE